MMNFLIEIFLIDFPVLFTSRRLPSLSFFFYIPLKFYLHAQIEHADFDDDEIVPACILANRTIVPTR